MQACGRHTGGSGPGDTLRNDPTLVAADFTHLEIPVQSAQANYQVTLLRRADELAALAGEFERLCGAGIERNVFYESWMLQAALRHLPRESVVVAVIRHRGGAVTGVFPFELVPRFRGLPLPALRSWRHIYCFLCTPLIHRDHAAATVGALLDWVASGAAPANLVEFEQVTAASAFDTVLSEALRGRRGWYRHGVVFQRALFEPQRSVAPGASGKHLKELRRLERRLAQSGALTYRVAAAGEALQPWLENFTTLEASGWKGREGTALASDAASRAYFQDIAEQAAERGQLQMMALELDGRPIAMKCNFLTGEGSFAFKIAFDEQFAKYSPGALLELFNMQELARAHPQVQWMDSCAVADHFMINRLWTGRRTVGTYWLARRGLARLLVQAWPLYHRLRRWKNRADVHQ